MVEREHAYTTVVVIDSSHCLAAADLDTDRATTLIELVSNDPSN